jgi:hypothetical protein
MSDSVGGREGAVDRMMSQGRLPQSPDTSSSVSPSPPTADGSRTPRTKPAVPRSFVRPYPGPGARIQVSDQGGWQPVWSGDTKRIFYRTVRAVWTADVGQSGDGNFTVTGRARLSEGDFLGYPEKRSASYDVHPDGNRFVLARSRGAESGRIVVWMNWIDEVETLLSARR